MVIILKLPYNLTIIGEYPTGVQIWCSWNSPAEVYYCVPGNHTFTDGILQIRKIWLGIMTLAEYHQFMKMINSTVTPCTGNIDAKSQDEDLKECALRQTALTVCAFWHSV